MSLLTRMSRDVGDADPVWRYMLEKIAHTALIAVGLHALFALELFRASYIAAALYLALSKLVVRFEQHDWSTFWRDGAFYRRLIFTAVVLALVPAIASVEVYGHSVMVASIGAWLIAFLVLDHFEWEGT